MRLVPSDTPVRIKEKRVMSELLKEMDLLRIRCGELIEEVELLQKECQHCKLRKEHDELLEKMEATGSSTTREQ